LEAVFYTSSYAWPESQTVHRICG